MSMETEFYDAPDDLEKSGTPLRRFWGKVVEVTPISEEGRRAVQINCTDLEIVAYPGDHPNSQLRGKAGVIAPYPYPVASLNINYRVSDRTGKPSERGAWGMFVKSVADVGVPRARDLVGKVVLFEAEPDHSYGTNRDTGEPMTGMVWRAVQLKAGQTASNNGLSDMDQLLALLNGKTKTEFNREALQSDAGRRNQDGILDGSLLNGLVATGRVSMDGDRYKVVPAGA